MVGLEGCLVRIVENFDEVHKVPPSAERLAGGDPDSMVALDPSIREDPSSYQEAKRWFLYWEDVPLVRVGSLLNCSRWVEIA